MLRVILALALLGACVSMDPFADVARAQERLDRRSLAFEVTRAPTREAFVLRPRLADTQSGLAADPMVAALAAAPPGCRLETITTQEDGASYRVDYDC